MSVILPYQYKYIGEKLAEAYAKIRDALYHESNSSAYSIAQETLVTQTNSNYSEGGVEAEPDTTVRGSTALSGNNYSAPPGSISSDLVAFWYIFANNNFAESNAKATAAGLIGQVLRKLNNHIVSRMAGIQNISQYYETYAYTNDADTLAAGFDEAKGQLSLFDYNGDPASWVYFSADFVELSSQIGLTIDSRWQA